MFGNRTLHITCFIHLQLTDDVVLTFHVHVILNLLELKTVERQKKPFSVEFKQIYLASTSPYKTIPFVELFMLQYYILNSNPNLWINCCFIIHMSAYFQCYHFPLLLKCSLHYLIKIEKKILPFVIFLVNDMFITYVKRDKNCSFRQLLEFFIF